MCLLKIYVEYTGTGERVLVAENVALISAEGGVFRLVSVEANERIVSNVRFSILDALNSTLILRAESGSP